MPPLSNTLLSLVKEGGELSEEAWSERYRDVSLAFGTPLAVASARGRIALGEAGPTPPSSDERGPADVPLPIAAEGPPLGDLPE